MLPLALIGALVPIGATFLLLQATRWDDRSDPAPLVLLIALAVGVGLGLSSCIFFLALIPRRRRAAGADHPRRAVAIGALAVAWRRGVFRPGAAPGRPGRRPAAIAPSPPRCCWPRSRRCAAFALNTIDNPHGEWDAWSIWNLRARWLFRAGPAWPSAFTRDAIHGDYPLLLPAAVARLWTYAGADLPAVPAMLAAAYAVALASLLYGSLAALRGRATGLLAALCLLGTPVFLRTVAWQYADIPLAFAMLATLALLAARDHDPACGPSALAWAGVAAGLAAWTKNEGLLFVLCIAAVRGALALLRRESVRPAAWFLAGLLPGAAAVVAFKTALAPPTYQFAGREVSQILAQLADASRYAAIASAVRGAALRDAGLLLLALVIYIALLGRTSDRAARARRGRRRAGHRAGRVRRCRRLPDHARRSGVAARPLARPACCCSCGRARCSHSGSMPRVRSRSASVCRPAGRRGDAQPPRRRARSARGGRLPVSALPRRS